ESQKSGDCVEYIELTVFYSDDFVECLNTFGNHSCGVFHLSSQSFFYVSMFQKYQPCFTFKALPLLMEIFYLQDSNIIHLVYKRILTSTVYEPCKVLGFFIFEYLEALVSCAMSKLSCNHLIW